MQIHYCFGCMEHIENYPCPHCGYSPSGTVSAYTLRPGTILRGKYLVGKVLGQGGFGITYIGLDLALNHRVAIKEFYPANCVGRENGTNRVLWYDSPQAQSAMQSGQTQFLKEARKMSRVSSISAVVHVFDVFQENETAYICMEFIEGQTLQQLLKQTGPLPWEKAKEIFLPVIQTMAQVHNQGLIHRDLSPDNLMIQQDGTIKILDLGAAKDLNLNTGISSMQVAKGGFSPLEQYLSSGESGSWTDVYALAATLYYALTGVVPPTSMDRLNRDTLRWDLPQFQTLPPEVHKALNHALAVRKEDRTQTMEIFAAELEQKRTNTPKSRKHTFVKLIATTLIVVVILHIGLLKEIITFDNELPVSVFIENTKKIITAEILIADIKGTPSKKLRSSYSEYAECEKFWHSEGAGTQTFSNTVTNTIPLYNKNRNFCGTKYVIDYSLIKICDEVDRELWAERYNSNNDPIYSRKSFYDISGKIREIYVGYDSTHMINYISDKRYSINGDIEHNILIDFHENDSYTVQVKDADSATILEKIFDGKGKLISS